MEIDFKINLNLNASLYSRRQISLPLFFSFKIWTLKAAGCETQDSQPLLPSVTSLVAPQNLPPCKKKIRHICCRVPCQKLSRSLHCGLTSSPNHLVRNSSWILIQITGPCIRASEFRKNPGIAPGSSQMAAELRVGGSASGFIHMVEAHARARRYTHTHTHQRMAWKQTKHTNVSLCHSHHDLRKSSHRNFLASQAGLK